MPYDKDQEARLRDAAPVSYEDAVKLGVEMDKSTRSVIAKVKSLELAYVPKTQAPKRPAVETKAELVELIEAALGVDLPGLKGATAKALVDLLAAVK